MKKKILLIMPLLLIVLGITYAFYTYSREGTSNNEIVTGQIYLHYTDNNTLLLTNIFPETKEKAMARTDNVINFTIDGKNEYTKKDLYYGISLNLGDELEGKSRIKPEHMMIYLECDGEVLINGIRYSDWDEQRIWVEKIAANTTEEQVKKYSLRVWVDEEVFISDTNSSADYTAETWNNSYVSLKLSVDGKLENMNMPLSIETSDTFVENNKAYFIAKISNYYDVSQEGLASNDNMNLEITGTNSDIVFSYKDSEGNVVEEISETLDLNYLFTKNKTVEIQVFVTPKNDANGVTDLNFKLTRNGELVQNFNKYMPVKGNNFCLNNGLNKLYDCILASDSLETDVETAKVNIANKGEVNLNDTAPSYTYVEKETTDVENVYSIDGYNFYFADSYEFNQVTGTFKIYNEDGSSVITDTLSDNYKNYYTCGYTINGTNTCQTIYRVKSTSVDGTKYTISLGDKITYKIASSIRSEVGLYKAEDDYGDSYFYRGDVTNNNVLFGGYYWKIIRTNGDNSIRLIYNGTTNDATGNKTVINNTSYGFSSLYPENDSPIGIRVADPTYVGYMYGKNYEQQTSKETTYTNIAALTKYYFADDFEFDEETEVFRLKENKRTPIARTLSEMNTNDEDTGEKLYVLYPYTCKSITEDGACEVLLQINSVVNSSQAKVIYHSYSSVDKESTRNNELSSIAKNELELWYEENIVNKVDDDNKLITEYIVDGTFCNNRSTPHSENNSGYLLNETTYYSAYTNLTLASDKVASLKCSVDENGNSDKRDWFSRTETKGNALLEYPIALITADEVALAGGKYNTKNENYYLKTGGYYWTMSPAQFYSGYLQAFMFDVRSTGEIFTNRVNNTRGLRPVINISSDVLISSGDGTIENPFTLQLAN